MAARFQPLYGFLRACLFGEATTFGGAIRPLVTASMISGATKVAGDCICQRLNPSIGKTTTAVVERDNGVVDAYSRVRASIQSEYGIDSDRALRFGVVGSTLHAPYMLVGFRYIDYVFGPAKTLRTVLMKTFAGQATLMPPYLLIFFYYMGWLEGLSHAQRVEKTKKGVMPAATSHMCFWPFANMVNFAIVPPQHRVPYVAVVGVVWSTLLSYAESFTRAAPRHVTTTPTERVTR